MKKRSYEKPGIVEEVVFAPRTGACTQVPPTIFYSQETNVTGQCGNLDSSSSLCSPDYGNWLGRAQ